MLGFVSEIVFNLFLFFTSKPCFINVRISWLDSFLRKLKLLGTSLKIFSGSLQYIRSFIDLKKVFWGFPAIYVRESWKIDRYLYVF